jgi:hypothetical protein
MKKKVYNTIYALTRGATSYSDEFLDVQPLGVLSDPNTNKISVDLVLTVVFSHGRCAKPIRFGILS